MVTFNPYDPKTAFLLGAGQNLLQAGGWSPVPVSMGQALGAGLQGGMRSYRDAVIAQRAAQRQQLEEGLQNMQKARAEAQQRYLATLSEEQQLQAQAMGVDKYMAAAMKEPKAPSTRKAALPGGMVQDQEFVGGEWRNVGEPYARRDPFIQVQGTDEQGRPVTQLVPRADVMAQFTETPQAQEVAVAEERPGVRRVTVATGERKKPSKEQAVTEANMGAALQDLDTAQAILFTDEGQLDRVTAGSGMAAVPGTRGRTGYQALRRAVEVLLRMRTGAAAPASEVETYMSLYAPSPMDSDEAAQNKMNQLRRIFEDTTNLMTNQQFEYQGGDVPADLPAPTLEAGTGGGASIADMPDSQILAIPPASIQDMSQAERDALDARLRAMGY